MPIKLGRPKMRLTALDLATERGCAYNKEGVETYTSGLQGLVIPARQS